MSLSRRLVVLGFCLAGVFAAGLAATRIARAKAGAQGHKPVSALVVFEGVLDRDGVGEFKAVRVANGEKLAALEAFFPEYFKRPTNNTGAGWMTGYHVYFDFPGGETVCVTVSQNQNAGSWSTGRGDFQTAGDFKAFIAGLMKDRPAPKGGSDPEPGTTR